MKIRAHKWTSNDGDRSGIEIAIDGENVFNIGSGEPEDMRLSRDLRDALKVPELLRRAHAAGVAGEPFEVEHTEGDYD